MRFPRLFRKRQEFADARTYTSDRTGAASDFYAGKVAPSAAATAAVEACVGLGGRLFAIADVQPAGLRDVITPRLLMCVARDLLTYGNSVYVSEVDGGRLKLMGPAWYYDVNGMAMDRSSWTYDLQFNAPDATIQRNNLGAGQVAHFMINEDPYRPWYGRGPLQIAKLTADSVAYIEEKLGHHANTPVAEIMAVPDGATLTQRQGIAKEIRDAKGRVIVPETMGKGWGQGEAAAPRQDMEAKRVGPRPDPAALTLRTDNADEIMAAYGLSPQFFKGVGMDMREAYRLYGLSTVLPIAKSVEGTLTRMYEQPVSLSFESAQFRDYRTISNSISNLVAAGLSGDAAAALLGIGQLLRDSDFMPMEGR